MKIAFVTCILLVSSLARASIDANETWSCKATMTKKNETQKNSDSYIVKNYVLRAPVGYLKNSIFNLSAKILSAESDRSEVKHLYTDIRVKDESSLYCKVANCYQSYSISSSANSSVLEYTLTDNGNTIETRCERTDKQLPESKLSNEITCRINYITPNGRDSIKSRFALNKRTSEKSVKVPFYTLAAQIEGDTVVMNVIQDNSGQTTSLRATPNKNEASTISIFKRRSTYHLSFSCQ